MKKKPVLFVGNDINNVNNDQSWQELLVKLKILCGLEKSEISHQGKPFPFYYEELFLKRKKNNQNERWLKSQIANQVNKINANTFHGQLMNLNIDHIITTNYDYTFEKFDSQIDTIKNLGIVSESRYSIFRHASVSNKKIWHIHGECNNPNSICLGFEHYGGQLQVMRNYVTRSTTYNKGEFKFVPIIRRLKGEKDKNHSWIDLFFKNNIHIIGLNLAMSEIDLWWLLTYRARKKKQFPSLIKNNIYYYYPDKLEVKSKSKLDLLDANGVILEKTHFKSRKNYYKIIMSKLNDTIARV